jgi:hypothetical protein
MYTPETRAAIANARTATGELAYEQHEDESNIPVVGAFKGSKVVGKITQPLDPANQSDIVAGLEYIAKSPKLNDAQKLTSTLGLVAKGIAFPASISANVGTAGVYEDVLNKQLESVPGEKPNTTNVYGELKNLYSKYADPANSSESFAHNNSYSALTGNQLYINPEEYVPGDTSIGRTHTAD